MSEKSMFLAQYGHEGHLHDALNSHDQNTIEIAAKNPSLSKDDMDKLVNSKANYKRVAIARNPNLSKEHLDKLVKDPEEDVRMTVAEHPATSKEHLDTLAKDKSDWVLAGMQHNKNLTYDQAKTAYSGLKDQKSILHFSFANTVKQKHGYNL